MVSAPSARPPCTPASSARISIRQPLRVRLNVPAIQEGPAHDCPEFTLSARFERETTSGAGANRVEDARRAFDNLFKK